MVITLLMQSQKSKTRKEETTPFGINLVRSQVLHRAAERCSLMYTELVRITESLSQLGSLIQLGSLSH